MSKSIKPIPVVTKYFGPEAATPIVSAVYRPGLGWSRTGWNKRVSRSWVVKLQKAGITHVGLEADGRSADFTVKELTSRRVVQ